MLAFFVIILGAIMPKTKSKSPATDKYQLITDQICELLERGTTPWKKPWKGGSNSPFQNLITKHRYTGSNPLWCLVSNLYHGYDSQYFLTFKQAKEQGWKIKNGAKSTWIKFASVKQRS
jgi:antirestriction protein ArdC